MKKELFYCPDGERHDFVWNKCMNCGAMQNAPKPAQEIKPSAPIKSGITNERQYIISLFEKELNKDRTGKYKPLTPAFIGVKMAQAGLKTTGSLRAFHDECKRAPHFGKFFWWSLKA